MELLKTLVVALCLRALHLYFTTILVYPMLNF